MKVVEQSVVDFLISQNDTELADLNQLVARHFSNIEPVLWRGVFWGGTEQAIIGYGHLTFTRSDKKEVDWFMVGLARQKSHLSLYISARGKDGYLANEFASKLGKVKVGAGRLSFAKMSDINQLELGKLLRVVAKQVEPVDE